MFKSIHMSRKKAIRRQPGWSDFYPGNFGCGWRDGLKVVPTVTEFMSVKKAITMAKANGNTIPEIRQSFDRQADTSYIESVAGKDLDIVKTADGFDVGVTYEKENPAGRPGQPATRLRILDVANAYAEEGHAGSIRCRKAGARVAFAHENRSGNKLGNKNGFIVIARPAGPYVQGCCIIAAGFDASQP